MAADLRSARPGEVYFAHLLAPHYPYSTASDCRSCSRRAGITAGRPGRSKCARRLLPATGPLLERKLDRMIPRSNPRRQAGMASSSSTATMDRGSPRRTRSSRCGKAFTGRPERQLLDAVRGPACLDLAASVEANPCATPDILRQLRISDSVGRRDTALHWPDPPRRPRLVHRQVNLDCGVDRGAQD